jgi:hypothetical protein
VLAGEAEHGRDERVEAVVARVGDVSHEVGLLVGQTRADQRRVDKSEA